MRQPGVTAHSLLCFRVFHGPNRLCEHLNCQKANQRSQSSFTPCILGLPLNSLPSPRPYSDAFLAPSGLSSSSAALSSSIHSISGVSINSALSPPWFWRLGLPASSASSKTSLLHRKHFSAAGRMQFQLPFQFPLALTLPSQKSAVGRDGWYQSIWGHCEVFMSKRPGSGRGL